MSTAAPSQISLGTGRRKTSVARVRLQAGSGKFTINNRPLEDFFHNDDQYLLDVLSPLVETGKKDQVDVSIRLTGGGVTGAAGACKLGIARALRKHDPETYAKTIVSLASDARQFMLRKTAYDLARRTGALIGSWQSPTTIGDLPRKVAEKIHTLSHKEA